MKIFGHRGASGSALENTLESIKKAMSLGVDYIEIDVWCTIDEEIIVFHDAYLERVSEYHGFVSEMDVQTLQNIKLKDGTKIPTLRQVVEVIKHSDVKILVELKSENALEGTLSILEGNLPKTRFVIGSFFHQCIKDLKDINPAVQTSIMFECVPVNLKDYLNLVNPDYVVVSIETFNDELLNTIKDQDRKLVFYTVNSLPEIEMVKRLHPYGIVTNHPELFTGHQMSVESFDIPDS